MQSSSLSPSGTPSGVDGEADLQYVRMAAETIAQTWITRWSSSTRALCPSGPATGWPTSSAHQPQPMPVLGRLVPRVPARRLGAADFMNPDRVVLGSLDVTRPRRWRSSTCRCARRSCLTDLRTAEMIKYASNAFLATRISFINEIANICEKLGADVKEVAAAWATTSASAARSWMPASGYGGSPASRRT
jgi:UDPglucose 6-dehydrogenase